MCKKSLSFKSNHTEGPKNNNAKVIQVFEYAPKEDNESSDTLSEDYEKAKRSPEKINTKEINVVKTEIDYCKLTISCTNTISETIAKSKHESPKKRRLFENFNENVKKRKEEIEEYINKQKLLKEESIEKHPNSLNIIRRTYTKSLFYFLNINEA